MVRKGVINVHMRKTHGMSHWSSEYKTWAAIKQRCGNPRVGNYKYYGGRGIKVCARWMDFATFYADMGPRPAGMTIERKDNLGDYEPGNCVWAPRRAQQHNTRQNRNFTIGGETHCLLEWCRRYDVPYGRVRGRLRSGWPIERALTEASHAPSLGIMGSPL